MLLWICRTCLRTTEFRRIQPVTWFAQKDPEAVAKLPLCASTFRARASFRTVQDTSERVSRMDTSCTPGQTDLKQRKELEGHLQRRESQGAQPVKPGSKSMSKSQSTTFLTGSSPNN